MEGALRSGKLASRLEAFEIEAEIGRGGMGAVLRARDRLLGRRVAVKVLADSSEERVLSRRFVVEAQLGAQLEHPNIVPFYEFLATADGQPAFAMKLVDGETLHAYLAKCAATADRGRSPPCDLFSRLDRFLKVCDAIDYAHARGVIHRDLKPGNVMLGPFNEVYVMDWGVARVLDDAADAPEVGQARRQLGKPQLTADGDIVGTPTYMAPEQARAEPVTPAADQYALGMMLAEISTLLPPREGSTELQLGAAVLGTSPLLESRFDASIPRELRAIILKATAKVPRQRYASVADLAAEVRRFMRDESVLVLRDPAWVRGWRWLKRRPSVVFGIIVACLALSSGLMVFGLLRDLRAQGRAALQSERVFALASAVDRTARGVDARFRRIELLLEGMAQTAPEMLQRPAGPALEAVTPSDLARSPLPVFLPRYAQKVTFERSVIVPSPGVEDRAIAPVLGRLAGFEQLLVLISARGGGGDDVIGYPEPRRREVARERSPILWTDLAFESGVLLVYPGNTFFPEGYDARARNWYVDAAARFGHVWGSVYPDATSGALIIPCSRAFHGPEGQRTGVAALHVSLEEVHGSIAVDGIEGYRSSALLDDHGDVVVSERTPGPKLEAGIHANKPLQPLPFEVPEVRNAILAGAREGRVLASGRLTVFRRLDTEGWLLAVTVDGEAYGF